MVYLSFNRFQIKEPTLAGTLIGKKSRATLLAIRKTGMSYGAEIKSPLAPPCPLPLTSLLVGIGDIAPILRDDSFFLRVMASVRALGEILRIDTIELSYRKSLFQPSHSPSGRERERAARLASR